jgi:hypothetical protein
MLTTHKKASKYFYFWSFLSFANSYFVFDFADFYFVSCIRFESGKENKIQDTSGGGPPPSSSGSLMLVEVAPLQRK